MTPRVYLDANVFIAAFENPGAHGDHAWNIFHSVEQHEVVAVTSELTLSEILVKPIERGAGELVVAYDRIISPEGNFEVLPVSRDVLVAAAHLRAAYRSLRLPDAVHLASAQKAACRYFITEDERLTMPDGLTRLPVNPFTVDDIVRGS
ncbi:type II toxin-antitoxin system VapC family toxin [Aquabacter sp. CN5-332]|uniref:type II toxin-antitoxin system VapC family toxin n=1 Tax=Aquabacter sp. CN5-332 TaxID=3156608 RepID=UPI0032B4A85E